VQAVAQAKETDRENNRSNKQLREAHKEAEELTKEKKALESKRIKLASDNINLETINNQVIKQIKYSENARREALTGLWKANQKFDKFQSEIIQKEQILFSLNQRILKMQKEQNELVFSVQNLLDEYSYKIYDSESSSTMIYFAEMQFRISRAIGSQNEIEDALKRLASLYDSANVGAAADQIELRISPEEVLEHLEEAVRAHRSSGDQRRETEILTLLASIYSHQGQLENALQSYNSLLEIYDSNGNIKGKANTLRDISEIYYLQEDFDASLQFSFLALELFKSVDDRIGQGNVLNNLGVSYAERGLKKDSIDDLFIAITYLQKSFLMADEINFVELKQDTRDALQFVLSNIEQHAAGIEYQRQCQQTAAATGLTVVEWCP
jgi:tetratricopeptide (TPR) repeat protein